MLLVVTSVAVKVKVIAAAAKSFVSFSKMPNFMSNYIQAISNRSSTRHYINWEERILRESNEQLISLFSFLKVNFYEIPSNKFGGKSVWENKTNNFMPYSDDSKHISQNCNKRTLIRFDFKSSSVFYRNRTK